MVHVLFSLLLISCLGIPAKADSQAVDSEGMHQPMIIDEQLFLDSMFIGKHELFLIEDRLSRDFSQIIADFHRGELSISPLTSRNIWLSENAQYILLNVDYRGEMPHDFILEHTFSYTNHLAIANVTFSSEDPAIRYSGDHVPFAERPVDYRNPSFPLHLIPGKNSFLIRIETTGPVQFSFKLWKNQSFNKMIRSEYTFIGLLFGFAMVMAAYNLLLAIRFKNVSYYLYVCYILSFMNVQFIFTGFASQFLPHSDFTVWYTNEGLVIAGEITAIFGSWFALGFLNIRTKTPILFRGIQLFFVISLINMILSEVNYSYSVTGILFTNGYVSFLLLSVGVIGSVRRFRPAYFYCGAWGCIILGSLITMAMIYDFLPQNVFTTWSQFGGGALELVLLSLALGDKMQLLQERAHAEISYLNRNLESLVDAKTKQIRSLLDHIPQGVLSISNDGILSEDYSAHLEEIIEVKEVAGRDFYELILAKSEMSSDQRDQIWQAILSCIGESELNFEANSDKLPIELDFNSSSGRKSLKVTWNIQVDDTGSIERLLVTLLDITSEKALEKEAQAQRQELMKIQELLSVPSNKIAQFFSTSLPLLLENKNLIDRLTEPVSVEAVKTLFVNAHTVKGAARTLHLQSLTAVIHETENYYSQILKDKVDADINRLQDDIMLVLNSFHAYIDINRNKLSRDDDFQKVAIEREFIENHYQLLRDIVDGQDIDMSEIISSLKDQSSTLTKMIFEQLPSIFVGYQEKLEKIATDMGRRIPQFELDIDDISISPDRRVVLDNCMIHILRNIVDHGLESAAERRAAGKGEVGSIKVHGSVHHGILSLEISDDGRGLPLKKLKERGLASGLIRDDASNQAIANLIFESGVSTATKLTEISGRGVGMNAVKTFLDRVGGSIQVLLGKPTTPEATHYHFRFLIRMPAHCERHDSVA